jgi:hypothetical protein
MSFVASEAGLAVGSLTVLSSHAVVDLPKSCAGGQMTRSDLKMLLTKVDDLSAATA